MPGSPEKDSPDRPADPLRADPVVRGVKRVTFAIYWVVILYLLGAGLVSVVVQVFWPASSLGVTPRDVEDCSEALDSNRAELMAIVAARLGATEVPDNRTWDAELRAWDRDFYALTRDCHDHPHYAELVRLRYRWEEWVRELRSELGPIAGPGATLYSPAEP